LTSGALAHDDIPLEQLTEELKVKPDPSRHPFFDLVISFVPMRPDLASGWSMTPMDAESGGAKWDLYLELNDRQEGLIGRAQYNPDVFDSRTIVRFLEHLTVVMECATANPRQRCSDFPLPTQRI
jgi:surfactin family lipopeptide synthetase A